jgi:hypothetical protein
LLESNTTVEPSGDHVGPPVIGAFMDVTCTASHEDARLAVAAVGVRTPRGVPPRASFDVTGGPEPERVSGLLVSTGLFPMLGVQRDGRGFTEDDGRPGAGTSQATAGETLRPCCRHNGTPSRCSACTK